MQQWFPPHWSDTSGVLGQVLGLQYNRDVGVLKQFQYKNVEHLTYKERLREMELFSLEKKKKKIKASSEILYHCVEIRWRYSAISSDRTRVNGHKFKYRKFHVSISKYVFTVKRAKQLNGFP